jgi:hypothetical protein
VRALYENQAGRTGSADIAAAPATIAGVEASLLEACFASPPLCDRMIRMRQQGTAAGV